MGASRGHFLPGGGGEGKELTTCPKKHLQVPQIFMKQSKRNRGHAINLNRPTYEMNIFSPMNLSYEPIKHVNRNI